MEIKLEGNQINIRKLKRSDAFSIQRNAKDYDISRYTKIPHPYTIKNAEDFVRYTHRMSRKKKAFELGIELKETKEIIGMMSFMNIDYKSKNAEIGYWLGKKYWGRRIMKEAVKLLLDFGFKRLKLVKVYARVMHPNIASSSSWKKQVFIKKPN